MAGIDDATTHAWETAYWSFAALSQVLRAAHASSFLAPFGGSG
jgi:hypothetical protein